MGLPSDNNKPRNGKDPVWLLFFYTVPAKPAGSRTKIWRKLARIGAIKLKGSIYLLPQNEEHFEILQWLTAELSSLGGSGAFAQTRRIEPFNTDEIISLFNNERTGDYRRLGEKFDALEQKIAKYRQESGPHKLTDQVNKLERQLIGIKKIDFFTAEAGVELKARLGTLKKKLDRLTRAENKNIPAAEDKTTIPQRRKKNYQNRTWVTRANPFVDRMACAWLIKTFIDRQATFVFTDDTHALSLKNSQLVTYDISGGEFTHVNELCTFEVIQLVFGLHDRGLAKLSRIVHALDLHDDKAKIPETEGVEMILTGIQKTAADSNSALQKGMDVFAALYASFT